MGKSETLTGFKILPLVIWTSWETGVSNQLIKCDPRWMPFLLIFCIRPWSNHGCNDDNKKKSVVAKKMWLRKLSAASIKPRMKRI